MKYKNNNRRIKQHLLRQSDKCAICGKSFNNFKEVSIDHIQPLSKGGIDRIDNMQLSHIICNSEKGDFYEENNSN